jgi:hypothetical protein
MRRNLLSPGALADAGYVITTKSGEMTLAKDGHVLTVPRERGLFLLSALGTPETLLASASATEPQEPEEPVVSLREAHETFAHIGKDRVRQFLTTMGFRVVDDLDQCKACMQGKMPRVSYHSRPSDSLANEPGVFHADLCAPTPVSLGGHAYFLCLTDEHSRFRKVYFLKSKADTAECI